MQRPNPNLEELRRQAKELLRTARADDESALTRIRAGSREINLSAAQNAVAREAGFPSCTTAKRALESFEALVNPDVQWSPFPPEISHTMGVILGDPRTREEAFLGAVFDEEFSTDREVHLQRGACPNCHARYEFETTILRGFADFIEAFCPRCQRSLGQFREDIGVTISVRLIDQPAKAKSARHRKTKRGGDAVS